MHAISAAGIAFALASARCAATHCAATQGASIAPTDSASAIAVITTLPPGREAEKSPAATLVTVAGAAGPGPASPKPTPGAAATSEPSAYKPSGGPASCVATVATSGVPTS